MRRQFTVISLFAGIGGFDLGLERAGFSVVGQVECDPFCQSVLEARWPGCWRGSDVRSLGHRSGGQKDERRQRGRAGREAGADVHTRSGLEAFRSVALLCGGFPCQDLSVAGKRKGLAGERSGLFWEIIRIAKAIQPTWGLFENVPGLISSHAGRDMATVLEGLRQCWPVVGYRMLDSQYLGVAQRRRRVFFVCGPTVAGVEQVLFESEGGGGDSAAGRETGTHVTGVLGSGSSSTRLNCDGDYVVTALRHLGHGGPDDNEAQGGHLVVGQCHGSNVGGMGTLRRGSGNVTSGVPFVTHALTGEGHDASEDGTGRGTPIVFTERTRKESRQLYDGLGVRRLTPTECERLQGFPDGWTCLCQPLESYDPNACTCPDSPRYRALGNAVTVNVIRWLGERLRRAIQ